MPHETVERAVKKALRFVNLRAHSCCRGPHQVETDGLGVVGGGRTFQNAGLPFQAGGGKASGKSSRTRNVGWTPRPSVTSGQARTDGASNLRVSHFLPFA